MARQVKKDVSRSYNVQKQFDGQRYSGMKVGRSHKWNYNKGVWRETKVTADRWEISLANARTHSVH